VISVIRNIIVITLVTVLIWLFAEAESLRPLQSTTEIVLSVPAQSSRTIDLARTERVGDPTVVLPDSRIRVLVDLDGASTAIDAAERVLRKPLVLTPDSPGVPRASGEHTILLREVLREHPELRSLAVTIRKCDPEEVRIIIDEMESRQLPIALDIPASELDGPPELRPATATIRGPKSLLKRLTPESAAMLRIAPEAIALLARGRKQPLASVPLTVPGVLAGVQHITFSPATADVGLTLRPQERSVSLVTVPVHIRLAPGELDRWDIQISPQDRFLTDVTLTGPIDAIKAVEDKTYPVIATVSLSFEELENNIKSKEAVFADLPPAVRATVSTKLVRLAIKARPVKTP